VSRVVTADDAEKRRYAELYDIEGWWTSWPSRSGSSAGDDAQLAL
jgi:hypothetical protein